MKLDKEFVTYKWDREQGRVYRFVFKFDILLSSY